MAAITAVKSLSWDDLAKALTKEPPEVTDKAARGWWTPTTFENSHRHGDNFVSKDAITFDFDHPLIDTWGNVIVAFADIPFCMYTTFTHRYDAPRFRVVVPLSRPCGADEFEAVARKLATRAGIENVARESFVAAQMCYLPTRRFGGEFEAYIGKGT